MFQRIASLALIGFIAFGAVSCKKKNTNNAAAAQAKFQTEQRKKALKAYQDLVKKYPDSEYAEKAKERIRALATPAPAKK